MSGFNLSGEAKSDLLQIRKYTVSAWGKAQWLAYSSQLQQAMAMLADNSLAGIRCEELGVNAYRFPLQHHTLYFEKYAEYILIVRVLQNSMCPAKHIKNVPDS